MAKSKPLIQNPPTTLQSPAKAPDVTRTDMLAGSSTSASDKATERLGTPPVQQTDVDPSIISAAAIYLYRQARFHPISQLDPQTLSWQLSEWNVGTMRRFSLTMDAVESRDAVTKCVTGKLKQSLSRHSYEIVEVDGADPAKIEAHTRVLKDFYANVTCTNAIDRNVRGGFSTLIHQMMDAALKRYAVHEIIWTPVGDEAERLTATFVFVPLWFFENRTGSLRFAGNFAWDGIPLKDGQWMVTVGDGIMEAITVAWMYKTISLRDWLIYSEKHGMPGIVGKTPFPPNSEGWKAMKTAVESVSTDFSAIIGAQDSIEAVQFGQQGTLPYPSLVEYMDKAISCIARGADLSTMSASNTAQGQGASIQGGEGDLIEQHYGQLITETLNHYVDPQVIKWHFGDGEEPCAYVKLNVPDRKDNPTELAIDQALVAMGVQLSKSGTCERYAREQATAEQIAAGDVLAAPAVSPGITGGAPGEEGGANTPGIALSAERKNWLKSFRGGMQGGPPTHPTHPIAQRLKAFREGNGSGDETASPRDRLAAFRESRKQLGEAADNLAKNCTDDLQSLACGILDLLDQSPDQDTYAVAVNELRGRIPAIAQSAPRTLGNAQGLLGVFEAVNHPWNVEN